MSNNTYRINKYHKVGKYNKGIKSFEFSIRVLNKIFTGSNVNNLVIINSYLKLMGYLNQCSSLSYLNINVPSFQNMLITITITTHIIKQSFTLSVCLYI